MSGGSYDYLGIQALGGFVAIPHVLERMAERLDKLPYAKQAAADTRALIEALQQVNERGAELADVWHAVEWRDSGDWSDEQMQVAIAEYRSDRERLMTTTATPLWALPEDDRPCPFTEGKRDRLAEQALAEGSL